jgi:hypothetical protein
MSELDKNKAGLQKQVSSAFKGVPLPESNGPRQPVDKPKAGNTHDASMKPMSADKQISKSSLISKLSQSEDSSNKAEQDQTANVFPKSTNTNRTMQSPTIGKIPRLKESLKQPAPTIQPDDGPSVEDTSIGLWRRTKEKLFTPKPGVNPTRQKALVIMVPILTIIMIFAFRQVLSKAPRQTEGAGTDNAPAVTANADDGHEIDWKIPEPITVIARDPIKLPDESDSQNAEQNGKENAEQNESADNKPKQGEIIIRDIVYSDDRPSAVIGSKIVYIGDKVNDATIVNINRDSIEFEKGEKRWVQKVRGPEDTAVREANDPNEDQPESK